MITHWHSLKTSTPSSLWAVSYTHLDVYKRQAYLLAVAPTSSTSILSGTSAGIDPIMKKFFLEEKKGSMLPVSYTHLLVGARSGHPPWVGDR